MVQKSLSLKVLAAIASRFLVLILSIIAGLFFFPVTMQSLVINTLHYQLPGGFFGFTFAEVEIAGFISSSLFAGVFFGFLGKKIDYIFIVIFFILASLDFYFGENMTLLVYSGLVVATILGNIIGFGLKILRKKVWK